LDQPAEKIIENIPFEIDGVAKLLPTQTACSRNQGKYPLGLWSQMPPPFPRFE